MDKKKAVKALLTFVLFLSGCAVPSKRTAGREEFPLFENRKDAIFSPGGSIEEGAAAYSPDGFFYAGELEPRGEGMVGIFNAGSGELLLSIRAQEVKNDLKGIAWSPDGSVLAVMYHGGKPAGIVFYDSMTGERLRHLEISAAYHFMAFGRENHTLWLSKPGNGLKKINLRNTGFSQYSGANLPWINYGWDVGRNPWGAEHGGFASERERLDEDLSFLSINGARLVRVFIFCDIRSGILFDEEGVPLRFDDFAYADFQALLDGAQKAGVLLIPVLFDYTIADGVKAENDTPVGEFPMLFTDLEKKEGLLKIFTRFFRRFASHPSIFAWDIINEPEHITGAGEKDVAAFVEDFVKVLRENAPEAVITLGALNRKNLGQWINAGFDIYQFHYFDAFEPIVPLDFPAVRLGLDRPVIAGELESTEISGKLTTLWENGYSGGLFWGLNDGGFREKAGLFRAWMSVH